MNNIAYFEIQAENPAGLVEFYTKVFGWECTKDENIPIEYWRVTTPGMNGGILKQPVAKPQGGTNAYTCSMMVENFDETAKTILENKGIVAMDKFAIPGKCWQGYFQDPQGNTFGLFQVDENAK